MDKRRDVNEHPKEVNQMLTGSKTRAAWYFGRLQDDLVVVKDQVE